MQILRNVDGQKVPVLAWDTIAGHPKTGDAANITGQLSQDGGASAATSDTNPVQLDATNQPGIYLFDLSQAETDFAFAVLTASSVTNGVIFDPVLLTTRAVSADVGSYAYEAAVAGGITLRDARTELARRIGMLRAGIATGGGNTTLIDTNGLARFTEDDSLIGALVYNRTQEESRWITDYAASTQTITVEYAWGTNPAADDVYEIYRAPMSLEQWSEAINNAINAAWPEIWQRAVETLYASSARRYAMPDGTMEVVEVQIRQGGEWREYAARQLPPTTWEFIAGDLYLFVSPHAGHEIVVIYQQRFPELQTETATTAIDQGYLFAQARANAYETLAGEAHAQAEASTYLQMFNHWQDKADNRRAAVGAEIRGTMEVKRE